ncbi:MAG TPA: ABC transporter substrate-binding protein [Anaerolineae bacterium]|nr:ABC transporter substrate-binding protein [Anaerolineae bacterium]
MRHRIPILVFTMFLSITACAPATMVESQSPELDSTTTMNDDPQSTTEGDPLESTAITLTDATGQELSFPAPPERIVFAGRGGQMLLHAAYFFPEAVDRIVGMEQRLQKDRSMLPLIDPLFDDKEQLERDASAEQIAPLHPDVVLMKTYMDELGDTIKQLNIPVLYLELETPEQFFRDITSLGDLFDNPHRAQEVLAFYQDRMDRVAENLGGLPEGDRPSVLLIQYDTRGGEVAFKVPSESWLQTTMVEIAGGNPVWVEAAPSGGWTVVNFEQIAAWDPDIVILVNYFDDPGLAIAELVADAKWQALRAVQDDELYGFPGDYLSWDQPDTRWIVGLQWLASVIHPDRFPDLDILEELGTFYSELYGIETAVFEDEIVPLITGDLDD